jgi:hypothetical protein
MKKGLVIILFLTMSLAGFAQQEVVVGNDTELVETVKAEAPAPRRATISAKVKAKVNKLNHKKSNQIISIKSFRKSLQIKTKDVKLC